jgi:hypothetical protein
MALKVKGKYPIPRPGRSIDRLPQRTMKREQRRKSMRRLITTSFVLAVLAGGAGIAYTWYMGQQKSAAASQPAPVYKPRSVIKPPKIASDAPLGVSVQTFTPEAKPGENASVTIRTNPAAECSVVVMYGTTKAVDSGLVAKPADEYGVASWSWTVAAGVPAGKAPVQVTCKNKKHSAVVVADVLVKP